ncbi:MAG: zinc-dependent metalloprotease [Bryobacteraceae bacterium]
MRHREARARGDLLGAPGHQVGLMLGYLGQHVLGQYDMALLGKEPLQDGQLYFIEPNIRATQLELGLAGDDFPMWVALHECTHAFQFQTFPWLRAYLNGLLRAYLDELQPEVEHLGRQLSPSGLADLLERIARGEPWMLWALTPRQREIFDRMQALMCLIEGYGNLVMKRVGRRILPTFSWIEAQVARRRAQRTAAEKLLARLTGLDLKMEQYLQGERFSETVADLRGMGFLNRAWERPENLPTLAEMEHPERWIARMEAHDVPEDR